VGVDETAFRLPERIDAVVLAASPNTGPLRHASPEPFEALIPVGGEPMVARVVRALAGARRVGRIACVGPAAVVQAAQAGVGPAQVGRVVAVAPGPGLVANLEAGMQATQSGYVLVATADIPLLRPAMVDDFVSRCEQNGEPVDVWYSVVERRQGEAAYPGVRRTWVRLADGTFTGGNLLLLRRDVVGRVRTLVTLAVGARKRPLALARLLGTRVMWRWLCGRLQVADVERRVAEMAGLRGRAVLTPHPEIGIDVDKPEDLALVRRCVQAGLSAP